MGRSISLHIIILLLGIAFYAIKLLGAAFEQMTRVDKSETELNNGGFDKNYLANNAKTYTSIIHCTVMCN